MWGQQMMQLLNRNNPKVNLGHTASYGHYVPQQQFQFNWKTPAMFGGRTWTPQQLQQRNALMQPPSRGGGSGPYGNGTYDLTKDPWQGGGTGGALVNY